jgi:hypothetical protein
VKGRLRPSLGDTLLTPAAVSAKQPARGLIVKRLAPASGQHSVEQGGAHTVTSTGLHTTRAATRWLPGAGAWVEAVRREGIDAWMAQRWGTCRRRRVALEQGRIWGTRPDRWAPSVSNGGSVTGCLADSRAEMGRGRCRAGPATEKMAHDGFSILEFLFHLTFQAGEKIN